MWGEEVEEVVLRILEEGGGVTESSMGRVGEGRLREVGVDFFVFVGKGMEENSSPTESEGEIRLPVMLWEAITGVGAAVDTPRLV